MMAKDDHEEFPYAKMTAREVIDATVAKSPPPDDALLARVSTILWPTLDETA